MKRYFHLPLLRSRGRFSSHSGGEVILAKRHTVQTLLISASKSTAINVERFVALARKYTDIRELTPEILRTFISKIVIHERPSRKKNEGEQRIDIYFTHIGSMPDSELEGADHCRNQAISARTAEFPDAHQKPISTIRA